MDILILILGLSSILIALAWLLPERWQLLPIGIGTAIFLGWIAPVSLIILLATGVLNYYVLQKLPSLKAATLVVVIQMCAIFIFFKLEYGLIFNITADRIIPLGLSFYSFRQIHYAIEAYKRSLPKHTLLDYLSYLFFLPTILVGPINRFQPFLKDMKRRRWDSLMFSQGLERILYGFVKVVVIGNFLLSKQLNVFAIQIQEEQLWVSTYLQMLKFGANAYVQFAGFSDIAIGLSMLFGFKIIENFDSPFKAKNISDFWNRWHISLSDWCRDYVFYPFLGITRNGTFSIIVSMLVLGLWHEISLRYIIWGISHAIAINIWHRYSKTPVYLTLGRVPHIQSALGIVFTIHFVLLSFVLVKEDTLTEAINIYKILFFLN